MFDRILSKGRARNLAKRLVSEPTVENYLALAQSYVAAGQLSEVTRVCDEALGLHTGCVDLQRMKQRAQALAREDRVRELQRQLKQSPRPALYKELCETLLAAGRLSRAEDVATEWYETSKDDEALYLHGAVRAERYFADRRRDDARLALERFETFKRAHPSDARPLRAQLAIYSRCGAWNEARTTLARLLELFPGEPALEARFRTVASLAEKSKGLDPALREVERTGRFVDDESESERGDSALSLRPMLQKIAEREGVTGAFYVRGGTALVQGPRGASAERYARGVREIVSTARGAARRLGLGTPTDVQVEGDFGSLCIRPGSVGAAALWVEGRPNQRTEEALEMLMGNANSNGGGEA